MIGSHINADYIYCKREDKTGQSMMYTFGAFTTTSEGIKYLDHDDTSYFQKLGTKDKTRHIIYNLDVNIKNAGFIFMYQLIVAIFLQTNLYL